MRSPSFSSNCQTLCSLWLRIGSLQDGYTTSAELRNIFNSALQRRTAAGLRDRLAMCLGHYALLRSSNILPIELADLSAVDLDNEGPSPCFAVILILREGKTNQEARIEYGSFTRSRDPETCAVGALAFWLFYQCVAAPLPSWRFFAPC